MSNSVIIHTDDHVQWQRRNALVQLLDDLIAQPCEIDTVLMQLLNASHAVGIDLSVQ